MTRDLSIIGRFVDGDPLRGCEYLAEDGSWGTRVGARVFPTHEAAWTHAKELGGALWPLVLVGSGGRSDADVLEAVFAKMERDHPHEEVFAATEARCGS